ncbi:MAG: DegT/DnrJ/EryC1/StrS family aminotransferase [Clostridiales Family XIII bacterium]|jgi:dTDP-4-amino-4,6-dideoxygalactose transaminase|nr:DegT/DnrJ/EryC1/StrS family aminotransferase [Clostridiales Family XIII bacterium]
MDKYHPDKKWLEGAIQSYIEYLKIENEYSLGNTSQILGSGAVKESESLLCQLYGCQYARLIPSASYGLRVCMQVSGVGIDDEVIIPEVDWIASEAAIVSLGAKPIYAPVNAKNIVNVNEIEELISTKTKSIVATHYNAIPVDVLKIKRVLGRINRPDVKIIEDCSQSFMVKYRNKLCGTTGDFAVFSFGPNKQIDIGECGMIICKEKDVYNQVIRYTGHPANLLLNGMGDDTPADALSIRPNPLSAVLLVTELRRIITDYQ